MELIITKKELNPLLSRVEIEATAKSETTPSYNEVIDELAEQLGKEKELIVIKNIYQKYGQPESTVNAFIYDSKETMVKFEGAKEEKKEGEKPAEEKAEAPVEKPAEEKPKTPVEKPAEEIKPVEAPAAEEKK